MSRKFLTVVVFCLAMASFVISGCGKNDELVELQGRYNELQKNNNELNEKYLKLYSDYEALKAEKEATSIESKYYEPSPGCNDVTIVAPTGEVIEYSTEKEKFKILEQMQIDLDKKTSGENANVITLDEMDRREKLINEYWELSGWGAYSP